jgi:uncharacterized protein YwgA
LSTQGPGKGKELKIVTRHVVTIDQVRGDKAKVRLLHTIKAYGEISEKALQHLVYEMKEAGVDLGYDFTVIGNVPFSKKLREDIVALLYVGLLETNPKNKKLRVTSMAVSDFLPTVPLPEEETKKIEETVEQLRSKVASIDAEVELAAMLGRRSRRRRRRF